MRAALLLLLLIIPAAVLGIIDGLPQDDFASGSNCQGTSFSCGTASDGIVSLGGSINITLTPDDGTTTAVCAIFLDGSTAQLSTCLFRQGQSTTSCDADHDVLLGNHSSYYVCPSGLSCAWNGQNGIPVFLTTPNTSSTGRWSVLYASYTCNGGSVTVNDGVAQTYHSIDAKGVTCSGTSIQSTAYDNYGGFLLGGVASCESGGFCDDGSLRNYTTNAAMNGSFCTPGCYDNIKDGQETDVDYGGAVCGNCTPDGKQQDAFYPFAREFQEGNTTLITKNNPFNSTTYCAQGEDVAGASTMMLLYMMVLGGVACVLIATAAGLLLGLSGVGIAKLIKKKP